jgi:CHASE3 domain sensor protein
VEMDVLAFLIMVLLLLAMGRLVFAALAIQKNTREVADHFKWLRERQEAQSQAAKQRSGTQKP